MSVLRKVAQPVMRRVKVFPIDQVTDIAPNEVSPKEAGLRQATIDKVWDGLVDCYREGLHPALSLCIRYRGQIVFHRTIGHAEGNTPTGLGELRQATNSTPFSLFSASKSVSAMIMHHLEQENKIRVGDLVVEYLPDFGRYGKERITIAQLLCHRAGIAGIPKDVVNLEALREPAKIRDLIYDMRLQTEPGRVLAYHALTSGFIFNEIVRAVTGDDIRAYMDKHFVKPMGWRWMNFGVKPEDAPQLAKHYYTGEPDFFPFSFILERALSVSFAEAVEISNDPLFQTAIIPSGNCAATADEACQFYQLLLNGGELNGVRIFEPSTIRRALVEQSFGVPDAMMTLPIRYSQGFMLGSKYLNVYGPNTLNAFGHMGFSNVVCWADSDRDISAALLNNGKPFISLGSLRWINLMRTITQAFNP